MAKKSSKSVAQSEAIVPVVEAAEVKSELLTLLTTEVKSVEVEPIVKVVKNEGVGTFVRKLIGEGLSNKEILAIVHEQYGNKNTTYACVAWYRNKVKKATAVASKAKAVETVEKFLEPEIDEVEDEVLSTEDLLQQVGQ